ncbi:MAG: myo-inosose-2 dehydratase [Promethearchaeota archaeon]
MSNADKIKLGISPIGWTNDDMPELGGNIPLEKCLSEIKEADFHGTEVGSKFPKDPNKLLSILKPYGIEIASQWFSCYFTIEKQQGKTGDTVKRFKNHMNFLKALSAKVIVVSEQGKSIQGKMDVPLFLNKPVLDEQEWEDLINGLNEIGKIAVEHDMKIVYHHHMGTVVQTRKEIDRLMESANPNYVYLLVDTGHIYYSDGGDSPPKLILDYNERIKHIHLKDVRLEIKRKVIQQKLSFLQSVKEGVFTVPGDGNIDFIKVFSAIKEIGYEGWLIVEAEQDPAKANPLEYALKARKYIKEKFGL